MANVTKAGLENAGRFILPVGSLIMLFFIFYPLMHMKMDNSPLVISLVISSLLFFVAGIVFHYRPSFCTSERRRWLPPFNIAVIAAICFIILLWALADIKYDVRASVVMMLSTIAAYFAVSEGTYIWSLQG